MMLVSKENRILLDEILEKAEKENAQSKNLRNLAQPERDILDKVLKEGEGTVRKAKILVFVGIAICSIAVLTLVYILAKRSDRQSFEIEYEYVVEQISKVVQWEVQYNFALMQQMSAAVTSGAILTGAIFPYVTVPHFEISGGYAEGMGGIMNLGYAPLIREKNRETWEVYSELNQGWLLESARLKAAHPGHLDPLYPTFQDHEHHDRKLQTTTTTTTTTTTSQQVQPNISSFIYRWEDDERTPEYHTDPEQLYAPLWQLSPAHESAVNFNLLSDVVTSRLFNSMMYANHTVLSEATELGDFYDVAFFDPTDNNKARKEGPHGFVMEPVYSVFEGDREIVGILVGLMSFKDLFTNLLPFGANGIHCVVTDSCGNAMTFELNGREAIFLGYDDLHETRHDRYKRSSPIEFYNNNNSATVDDGELCVHELHITPSESFVEARMTHNENVHTCVIAAVVATGFLLFIFLVYDALVTRRQKKTMENFIRTSNLVASVFPEHIRDRLLRDDQHEDLSNPHCDNGGGFKNTHDLFSNAKLKENPHMSRPLADFYPNTTIMFADISGFTAWCSTREPFEVFTLLETIYGSFDKVAKRRHVFKVETVGDCYVAVCGLPQAKKDHAVTMARFACDCLVKMKEITHRLEKLLGPDTGDLAMRVGLNSGSVTAGVLRGENARFQLFGDTVNTAARMESTGLKGRIQVSKGTAVLLEGAGKGNWLLPRENKIFVKGKGEMETFWLDLTCFHAFSNSRTSSTTSSISNTMEHILTNGEIHVVNSDKTSRLVGWTSDVLLGLLTQIVAQRNSTKATVNAKKADESSFLHPEKKTFDEVKEVISLPHYDGSVMKKEDIQSVVLKPEIIKQMNDYVGAIASLYKDNPFHNFEHATHVTNSVKKLLSRIVAPSDINLNDEPVHSIGQLLHEYTYGITSDPLTQFACVFSAIIHDVDHSGVSNAQLIKEDTEIARYYNGKSVAEQNSVDLAWNLLMKEEYRELRQTIYANDEELKRFRQLVVNAVLATDIVDKELKMLRDARFARAFSNSTSDEDQHKAINRKGTIVIEHLLQASDVSHTMQHWHIYRKWNERFFMECHKAYKEGRSEKDPSETWYQGEIGFFDFYIIPLAKKLKECGVFGVSHDEYLDYALANRREWELRGREIVAEMVEATKENYLSRLNEADADSPQDELINSMKEWGCETVAFGI